MSEQIQIQTLPMDRQTELILKYGPKDTCWAATYQKEDEPLLKKIFYKICNAWKRKQSDGYRLFSGVRKEME